MNASPFGLAGMMVLLIGTGLIYLTSTWSPVNERNRLRITWLGISAAYLTILPGLAYAKSNHTFLAGEDKPGIFYSWAFGLWFALVLLRSGRAGFKAFGVFSSGVFGLLLANVIAEEFRLVLND